MDNTTSHLNLPSRIHEPEGGFNNKFFDGEITYVIEAPREWWEGLRSDKKVLLEADNYRVKNPRAKMYETFPLCR